MLREKWLAAAIGILTACFAQNDASAADVFCFKFPTAPSVNGVTVNVPIRFYRTDGMLPPCLPLPSNLKGVANLSDLQSKIPQIVARIPLPRDNCAGYGLNIVLSLSDPRLFAPGRWPIGPRRSYYGSYGNNAQPVVTLFQTNGKAVIWDCAKNPVPKVTVVWETRSFRILRHTYHYRVPVVTTSERPPIKTILATQPFTYYQALTLRRAGTGRPAFGLPSTDTVEIVLGMNDIDMKGKYVEITRLALGNFISALNSAMNQAAQNVHFSFKPPLPPGWTIDNAQFVVLDPPNGPRGALGAELLLSR